jgi:RND family efflux transporter MFP subunit
MVNRLFASTERWLVSDDDTNMTNIEWLLNRIYKRETQQFTVDIGMQAWLSAGHNSPFVKLPVVIILAGMLSANNLIADDTEALPEFDCVIEPSEVADLGSAIPGVVGKIHAKRSDPVRKGDIVAELDSTVERANLILSKARAETETAIALREESAAFGRRTAERNQTLFQHSSISEQDIDKLNTENRIAQLQVHQEQDNKNIAKLEYERAKAVLDRHLIRTPFDGVVMERFKTVGEYIEDDPVVRVAQLDPLHVEVLLPVEYMGKLAAGRLAEVTPSLPGFEGKVATVTRVDAVADAASDTFGARLSLSNPDYAVPAGLRCRLAFLPQEELTEPLADEEEDEAVMFSDDNPVVDEPLTSAIDSSALPTAELPENEEQVTLVTEEDAPYVEEMVAFQEAPDLETETTPVSNELVEDIVASEVDVAFTIEDSVADFNDGIAYANECYTIGPLASEKIASELSNTVHAIDNTSQPMVNLVSTPQKTDYRVLATSQQDPLAAGDLEGYLIDYGVEDIYRLRSGEYEGRVSVGLYGRESNALARQESLRAKGIEAEIVRISRELSTYWIYLSFNSSPNSQFELQTVAMSVAPEASVQQTQCNQQQVTGL